MGTFSNSRDFERDEWNSVTENTKLLYETQARSTYRQVQHAELLKHQEQIKDKKSATKSKPYGKCGILLISLISIGALLILGGGLMFVFVPRYIRDQVTKRVVISTQSETYEIWQDIPVPVYMQFWVFNIGNPQEVRQGQKPVLEQIGPFTYRERRVKFDIDWDDENSTVQYRQNRTFEFNRNMSFADDEMKITTINPLIATIAQNMQWWDAGFVRIVATALRVVPNEDIIMERPVREVLFGYEDPALTLLHNLPGVKELFPTTKIGYFIRRNATDDGLYKIYTGAQDYHRLGFIKEYNGADKLDQWTTKWANMINGTDGTLGPPFRFDAEQSPVFVSDICRSIRGVYKGEVSTPQGIKLRRFGGDTRDMANATINPDNLGFCIPQTKCLPTGLLNSTLCQQPVDGFKLPVVFSFPHFLDADPEVQASVVGLKPEQKEHETVIDQEPWTGLVLQVAKRLQINMYVQKVPSIGQTHNIQSLFFPICWLNESSVINDHWAHKLQSELFTPMELADIGKYVLIGVGAAMVVLFSGCLAWRRRTQTKTNTLVKEAPAFSSVSSGDAYDGNGYLGSSVGDGGRQSVDTFDGQWYDPSTFDGDRVSSSSPTSDKFKEVDDTLPLVNSEA